MIRDSTDISSAPVAREETERQTSLVIRAACIKRQQPTRMTLRLVRAGASMLRQVVDRVHGWTANVQPRRILLLWLFNLENVCLHHTSCPVVGYQEKP